MSWSTRWNKENHTIYNTVSQWQNNQETIKGVNNDNYKYINKIIDKIKKIMIDKNIISKEKKY